MHKSIFTQFFYLCFSILLSAVIIISCIHVFLSVETYRRDRKDELVRYTEEAVQYTEIKMITCDSEEEIFRLCGDYYSVLHANTESDLFITDSKGMIRAASEGMLGVNRNEPVPENILMRTTGEGTYEFGTLSGYYNETFLTMSYKISYNGQVYYLFGRLSTASMRKYLIDLTISFLVASVLIIAAAYPLLYHSIMRFVKPLREMTMAAQRFGEGDFSSKISVTEHNELGFLGNSLNEMAGSLEAIEEDRKSFVSNVSHELKTPMTTIGGFVDGILDGTIPKSEHKYYLRIVSEEVDRLARLVRSMLNISKYESGEIELQTESFELSNLIFKTALLFEKRINDKNVEIEGLGSGRFFINADIDLAQQVIYNLTENAVKFVNTGGVISFDIEEKGEFTAVRIRNTGEGLKQHEISKVFERFYKTDESRGKDKTGVGLGLSIVRSIIKLHNGTILVRSKPDEYTEFEFTFPTGSPPPKRKDEEQQGSSDTPSP